MSERSKRPPDALSRAVGLLARREHSRRELARKLAARGFDAPDIDAALNRLEDKGLQDDQRFADTLIRTRVGAGHGPTRIRAELGTHGLDEAAIDAALDEHSIDWLAEATHTVARRHPPDTLVDPIRRRKAAEFLLRRGFDLDTARAAIDAARRGEHG